MAQNKSPKHDDARSKEARRILDRVTREAETVGTSSMARTSDWHKADAGHKSEEELKDQAIEDLGRKIGRSLGWIAVLILAVYLIRTYLF